MKKRTKNIIIVGGSLAVLYYLISAYALGGSIIKETPKKAGKPKTTKPPRIEIDTPTPTPPFIPQSSGGGTGGMVTNNQTVPQNYNPRDYGDIVLGNVDRGGNILR